ncbi:MAG: protein-glutamate methylesterase/protein-glutamine glutaminase [bacterium]
MSAILSTPTVSGVGASAKRVRVLIVDDSLMIRTLLSDLLSKDLGIEVVGAAQDPYVARDMIKQLNPDVLTLDVEMPRMDGISFLRNLMRLRPMPVVMISSLTQEGSNTTLEALSLGAVDYVPKPSGGSLRDYAAHVRTKVKMAASANLHALGQAPAAPAPSQATRSMKVTYTDRSKLIAIGSSTGGTEAVKDVLLKLSPNMPGIVITQHIPASFSGSFARRLNDACPQTVKEAEDGDRIMPGHVYIAPGHSHLEIAPDRDGYLCKLNDGEPVNHHRPSVEVLFNSVTRFAGRNAVGVMLTGMGDDGATAMVDLHNKGSFTIAQDEKSSVVWGMPGAAVRLGAADEVLSLGDIPSRLMLKFGGK